MHHVYVYIYLIYNVYTHIHVWYKIYFGTKSILCYVMLCKCCVKCFIMSYSIILYFVISCYVVLYLYYIFSPVLAYRISMRVDFQIKTTI